MTPPNALSEEREFLTQLARILEDNANSKLVALMCVNSRLLCLHDALRREPGEVQLLDRIRLARSGVSDERLPELKLWLDRKWNRHQEEEDLEAGNALCELIAIRAIVAALASSQAGKCSRCGGTGLVLEHPADTPFSQSLAAIDNCPSCRPTQEPGR